MWRWGVWGEHISTKAPNNRILEVSAYRSHYLGKLSITTFMQIKTPSQYFGVRGSKKGRRCYSQEQSVEVAHSPQEVGLNVAVSEVLTALIALETVG